MRTDMQKYVDWRNSPCGLEVAKFATEAIDKIAASQFRDIEPVRPMNMHVTLGLMGSMLPMPMGHILRDLATFFYENPDSAVGAWDAIRESMDPLNKRGWIG